MESKTSKPNHDRPPEHAKKPPPQRSRHSVTSQRSIISTSSGSSPSSSQVKLPLLVPGSLSPLSQKVQGVSGKHAPGAKSWARVQRQTKRVKASISAGRRVTTAHRELVVSLKSQLKIASDQLAEMKRENRMLVDQNRRSQKALSRFGGQEQGFKEREYEEKSLRQQLRAALDSVGALEQKLQARQTELQQMQRKNDKMQQLLSSREAGVLSQLTSEQQIGNLLNERDAEIQALRKQLRASERAHDRQYAKLQKELKKAHETEAQSLDEKLKIRKSPPPERRMGRDADTKDVYGKRSTVRTNAPRKKKGTCGVTRDDSIDPISLTQSSDRLNRTVHSNVSRLSCTSASSRSEDSTDDSPRTLGQSSPGQMADSALDASDSDSDCSVVSPTGSRKSIAASAAAFGTNPVNSVHNNSDSDSDAEHLSNGQRKAVTMTTTTTTTTEDSGESAIEADPSREKVSGDQTGDQDTELDGRENTTATDEVSISTESSASVPMGATEITGTGTLQEGDPASTLVSTAILDSLISVVSSIRCREGVLARCLQLFRSPTGLYPLLSKPPEWCVAGYLPHDTSSYGRPAIHGGYIYWFINQVMASNDANDDVAPGLAIRIRIDSLGDGNKWEKVDVPGGQDYFGSHFSYDGILHAVSMPLLTSGTCYIQRFTDGQWVGVAHLPERKFKFSTCLHGSRLFVVGGRAESDASSTHLQSTHSIDLEVPELGWTKWPDAPFCSISPTLLTEGSYLLALSSIEEEARRTWFLDASLPAGESFWSLSDRPLLPTFFPGSAVVNNYMILCSGTTPPPDTAVAGKSVATCNVYEEALTDSYILHRETNEWLPLPSLMCGRIKPLVLVDGSTIMCCGGFKMTKHGYRVVREIEILCA